MKTTILAVFAIVTAVSIISMSGIAAPALAYKNDHDHDDYKDLKHFNHCIKYHGGGDIRAHYFYRCGEKYLERV